MKKTILIAPFGSHHAAALASALAAELAQGGWSPALAQSLSVPKVSGPKAAAPNDSPQGAAPGAVPEEAGLDRESPFRWNPSSYVSTGALLLSAKNSLGDLDAAIIVVEAGLELPDLLEAAPGSLSKALEEALLGPALLSRELLRRFAARRAGRLLLVSTEAPEPPPLGPSAALAAGAFRGLGEGLFAAARASSWDCLGLLDRSGRPDLAARHCIRLLEEAKSPKAGRWLSFTGKPGLFAGR